MRLKNFKRYPPPAFYLLVQHHDGIRLGNLISIDRRSIQWSFRNEKLVRRPARHLLQPTAAYEKLLLPAFSVFNSSSSELVLL